MFSSDTFADPVSKLCNQIIQTGDLFVFVCVCLCVCVCVYVYVHVCVLSAGTLTKKFISVPELSCQLLKLNPGADWDMSQI